MSPKFVVAKLSSQTLRGLRQLCEALNSNAKFHFYLVIHNVYDTLKKSSSFRTFRRLHEICEAFNSNYTSRFHGEQFIQDFTTTSVMHQARLILPLHLHSFGGLNRVWPFLENSKLFCCAHFQLRKKYDTQMTQILPRGVHLYSGHLSFMCGPGLNLELSLSQKSQNTYYRYIKNTFEMFKQLLLALFLGGAQAWTGMDAATGMSRRHLFGKVASGVIVAGPASAFAADLMCPVRKSLLQ